MQYSTLLTMAAAAAFIGSGMSMSIPRQYPGSFNVTNFFASSERFGLNSNWQLDVTDGITSAVCIGSESTEPPLIFLPVTCCQNDDCAWQFSFSSVFGGFNLNITNVIESAAGELVDTGIMFFPQNDSVTIVDPDDPNGDFQVLEVPSSFLVPFTTTVGV